MMTKVSMNDSERWRHMCRKDGALRQRMSIGLGSGGGDYWDGKADQDRGFSPLHKALSKNCGNVSSSSELAPRPTPP